MLWMLLLRQRWRVAGNNCFMVRESSKWFIFRKARGDSLAVNGQFLTTSDSIIHFECHHR